MNAKGAIVGAVFVILAVAIFLAVYLSTRGDGSSSDSFAYNEFTGTGSSVSTTGTTYTSTVYSKLTVDSNNRPTAWVLEAQVDYTDSGVAFRHVYTNGRTFFGTVENNGYFNITQCQLISQETILSDGFGSYSFAPVELNGDASTLMCSDCKLWTMNISAQNFFMEEKDGVPKFLYSRDQTVTVSTFTFGKKTWSAPEIADTYDELCIASDNSGSSLQSASARVDRHLRTSGSIFVQEHADARPIGASLSESAHEMNRRMNRPVHIQVTPRGSTLMNTCLASMRGDGRCDDACNNPTNNFDNGDCCPGTCTTGRTFVCGRPKFDCKATGRICLFVHGVGVGGPAAGNVRNDNIPNGSLGRANYWGSMLNELNGICSSFRYLHADTNNYGWNVRSQQDVYYNAALDVVNRGGIVFAHSMGNLILGGACLDQGKCSVRWINVGGPIRGSKGGDIATVGTIIAPFAFGPAWATLRRTVSGLADASVNRNGVINRIQSNNLLVGSVCGTAGWGGGGLGGAALAAAKTIIYGLGPCNKRFLGICYSWANMPADGVVHIDECGNYGSTSGAFRTSWNQRWYEYDGNHYDETGTSGNHRNIYDWYRYISNFSLTNVN